MVGTVALDGYGHERSVGSFAFFRVFVAFGLGRVLELAQSITN
jgi:hypothetical protein